jgi:hypothetical protein
MKPKKKHSVKVLDEQDNIVEVADAGVPGLFKPTDCDVMDELSRMDSFMEEMRDRNSQFGEM